MAGFIFHELRNDQHAISCVLEHVLELQRHNSTLERAELSMLRDAHLHASHSQVWGVAHV